MPERLHNCGASDIAYLESFKDLTVEAGLSRGVRKTFSGSFPAISRIIIRFGPVMTPKNSRAVYMNIQK